LVINLFLSSALLGTSLPHMFLKIISQPDAVVFMPCAIAILASEAAAGTEAAPILQVFVSLFLLATGLRGILLAPSSVQDDGAGVRNHAGMHGNASSARQSAGGASQRELPPPFTPDTNMESQQYSPHFLVTRYARGVAQREASPATLITLVERLDGSGQHPRKGRDRGTAHDREERGSKEKHGKGEGKDGRASGASRVATSSTQARTSQAPSLDPLAGGNDQATDAPSCISEAIPPYGASSALATTEATLLDSEAVAWVDDAVVRSVPADVVAEQVGDEAVPNSSRSQPSEAVEESNLAEVVELDQGCPESQRSSAVIEEANIEDDDEEDDEEDEEEEDMTENEDALDLCCNDDMIVLEQVPSLQLTHVKAAAGEDDVRDMDPEEGLPHLIHRSNILEEVPTLGLPFVKAHSLDEEIPDLGKQDWQWNAYRYDSPADEDRICTEAGRNGPIEGAEANKVHQSGVLTATAAEFIPSSISVPKAGDFPAPEPAEFIPVPEPAEFIPTPEPVEFIPTPEPAEFIPTPEPMEYIPTPEAVEFIATPDAVEFVAAVPEVAAEYVVAETGEFVPASVCVSEVNSPEQDWQTYGYGYGMQPEGENIVVEASPEMQEWQTYSYGYGMSPTEADGMQAEVGVQDGEQYSSSVMHASTAEFVPSSAATEFVPSAAAAEFVPSPAAAEFVPSAAAAEFVPSPAAAEFVPSPAAPEFVPSAAATEFVPSAAATEFVPSAAAAEFVPSTMYTEDGDYHSSGLQAAAAEFVPSTYNTHTDANTYGEAGAEEMMGMPGMGAPHLNGHLVDASEQEWWDGYSYGMQQTKMNGTSMEDGKQYSGVMQAAAAEFVPASMKTSATSADPGPFVEEENIMPLVDPDAPEPGCGRASAVRGGKGSGKTDDKGGEKGWRSRREGKPSYPHEESRNGGSWHDKGAGKAKGKGRGQDESGGRSVQWAYIDPQDQVRVGFTSESMRKWYDAGYFDKDLMVAIASGRRPPPRSEFYRLKQWFPNTSKVFTYVPKF